MRTLPACCDVLTACVFNITGCGTQSCPGTLRYPPGQDSPTCSLVTRGRGASTGECEYEYEYWFCNTALPRQSNHLSSRYLRGQARNSIPYELWLQAGFDNFEWSGYGLADFEADLFEDLMQQAIDEAEAMS